MNKCEHIKAQLLDLDVLTPIQDPALELHLKQCSDCAAYFQDLLALQNQIDNLPEHDVSDDVFAKTLAAVQLEANSAKPASRKTINQQWASGLAASFVLVAVAGLLYNGSMSDFQGDFSQVAMETEQELPAKPKPTPWVDPEGADDITVELVDLDEVQTVRQRRMSNLNQPSQSAVSDTLKQIYAAELGAAAAPEQDVDRSEPQPPMPDLLRDAAADVQDFSPAEATADMYVAESEPVLAAPVFEDRAKVVEKKKESKPNSYKLNESVATDDKDHVSLPLDQLLETVGRSVSADSEANRLREAQFRAQRARQAKLKADSTSTDGLASNAPQRDNLNEANKGFLRKDNRTVAMAATEESIEADEVSDDQSASRIVVTGARIKRQDVAETTAAEAYLAELAATEGLAFKPASGYWANTYLPGDSNMRWLQAQLGQSGSLELPAVRQNLQPFDAPSNAALALYVNSDRSNLEVNGPTRMRVQVGLQAGKQKGGHRSALNLALVLDLGDQPAQAELKALLDALLKNKRSSDQVTVFITGTSGGQLIQASDFRHGPIQVMLNELFNNTAAADQPDVSLEQGIQAATQWLKTQDDPNAVLGSSAIWLVSANRNVQVSKSLENTVHHHATEGITFSTLAIGETDQRDALERLALQGQGHSRVMTGVHDAERVIQAEMMATSRAVARALRLQIRLAEGVQLIDVLGSYSLDEAQAQQVRVAEQSLDQRMAKNLGIIADRGEDEDGIQMVIPSFFAGDTHVLLLDVLVNHSGTQALPVVEVNAKYKDLIYLNNASSSKTLDLATGPNQLSPLELNVMKNVLAHRFANTMKQAAGLLNGNNRAEAVQELSNMLRLLQAMRTKIPAWNEDREIRQDEHVIKQYLNLLATQSSIDPEQYQLIVTSMNVNSWRRLLTHSP